MVVQSSIARSDRSLSDAARRRMFSLPFEPLFLADWLRTLMIHYQVDPAALQQVVPFELDLRDGRAFVSVVAFTLRAMRLRFGGRATAWLLKPISTHDFLNVRTYVRSNGETGIYFLAEWLSNRLSVMLGPRAFGLPYRFGRIEYNHDFKAAPSIRAADAFSGRVVDAKTRDAFIYDGRLAAPGFFRECERGTLTEWLMERHTAFTNVGRKGRFFRVWHHPWPQVAAAVCVTEKSLLDQNWPLFCDAQIVGANFSPGVTNVWMGWPHGLGT